MRPRIYIAMLCVLALASTGCNTTEPQSNIASKSKGELEFFGINLFNWENSRAPVYQLQPVPVPAPEVADDEETDDEGNVIVGPRSVRSHRAARASAAPAPYNPPAPGGLGGVIIQ